jgi:ABC-type transporter Mla MlaB component
MATQEHTVVLSLASPIERSDLPDLFKCVCDLLASSGASLAICDVSGVAADAVSADALARLKLAGRRHGCRVRLLHASSELHELMELMGLGEILSD